MENKQTKVFPDFENEIKAIDPRLSIVQNPNRQEIANIKLDGVDVCPIPSTIIFDTPNANHKMIAPNGWEMRHKSKEEALSLISDTLEKVKTKDGYELFYGRDWQGK